MKTLIICGYFDEANIFEVVENATSAIEISANKMQEKLISGFKCSGNDVAVLSAPFIGAYPMGSRIKYFRKFKNDQSICTYVKFNNIWGIRNFSRSMSLKRALNDFIYDKTEEKVIVIYCAHTPFLEAAVYAKKKDPKIKLCLYVPDLPEYMNLSSRKSLIYSIAKKYDIKIMSRLMKKVDGYVLLTEHMKNALPVGEKPYIVCEGLIDRIDQTAYLKKDTEEINVVYTGKLYEKFGVKDLIDSFKYIKDDRYRLILCGSGDCDEYARTVAQKDRRIILLGQIMPDEAVLWQKKTDVLVNPRPNNDEYTKYSFPSKNIEYLLTGNPVVGYMLDGMPDCYRKFMCIVNPEEDCAKVLADGIQNALSLSETDITNKYNLFVDYAEKNLLNSQMAESLLKMLQKGSRA
jgi:glycosyltransferase involved in cell wall biosynthesis